MKSHFEFYSNGILYRVETDGKLNACVDLKKVVQQIEVISALDYFQKSNDKNIKKLHEKEKSNFFINSDLKELNVMLIPIKPNSSKKWILFFTKFEKSR